MHLQDIFFIKMDISNYALVKNSIAFSFLHFRLTKTAVLIVVELSFVAVRFKTLG